MAKEEKPEESTLFPKVEVGKHTIRPWSFGILFDIAGLLGTTIDKAEEKGLIEEFNVSGGMLKYTTMAKLFSLAGPEVLEIITKTLGTSEKEVRALSMEHGIRIALVIYEQNSKTIADALKNVFGTPLPEKQESGDGVQKK